jgi:hypothetical protein
MRPCRRRRRPGNHLAAYLYQHVFLESRIVTARRKLGSKRHAAVATIQNYQDVRGWQAADRPQQFFDIEIVAPVLVRPGPARIHWHNKSHRSRLIANLVAACRPVASEKYHQ